MRHFVLAGLAVVTFAAIASPIYTQRPSAAGRAVIQKRTIVLTRSAALTKNFPEKRKATVTYPIVSGLSPVVLKRVRALLDFKNIFDYSLKEYQEDAWLEEFTYVVNHNGNSLLDITFNQSGSGAYPDEQDKHFLIDLNDGKLVKARDAFESAKLPALRSLVDAKLKAELKDIIKELHDSNSDPEDVRTASEAQEPLEYKLEDLDNFSINSKGVTFLYDAGYPHVIRALQPLGKYFFSYNELKPFIRRDGPLGQFLH